MRPREVVSTAAALVVAIAPAASHAAHPLETDDAWTLGAGAVEVELSGSAAQQSRERRCCAVDALVSVQTGLHRRVDLGFSVTAEPATRSLGLGVFDLKWLLREPGAVVPGLALRLDVLPGPEATELAAIAIATWEAGPLQLHVNAGATSDGGDRGLVAAANALAEVLPGLFAGGELARPRHRASRAPRRAVGGSRGARPQRRCGALPGARRGRVAPHRGRDRGRALITGRRGTPRRRARRTPHTRARGSRGCP